MTIRAILFDADGVLQQPGARFHQFVAAHSSRDDPGRFWRVVGAAEKPCLTGKADFREALAHSLRELESNASLDEAIAAWNDIEIESDALDLLRELLRSGVVCALVTNQNQSRAKYMRQTLELDSCFDFSFYSCSLGAAKPDAVYFQSVVDALQMPARECLFIDDSLANVEAARALGLVTEHFEAYAGVEALKRIVVRHLSLPLAS